jgi:hypothetical protein
MSLPLQSDTHGSRAPCTPAPGSPGQGERRESATDVRLDGDEMTADPDDGDAGHFSGTYMIRGGGTVAGWNSQDLVSPTAGPQCAG